MSGVVRRDISPFLQTLRNFLLGRNHNLALRFEDGIAARTQPNPQLPDGPAHILSANHYVLRDGRREVAPPINLTSQTLIDAGQNTETEPNKLPTPGKVFHWD